MDLIKYEDINSNKIEISLEIIKKYFCPLASDQEAMMFLKLCEMQRLNPFLREVYLVKYKAEQPATMVTGKETFTKRANKRADYKGMESGVIVLAGETIINRDGGFWLKGQEKVVGAWARVFLENKSPVYKSVAYDEYVATTWKDGRAVPNKFWSEKPATMIIKVAEVQALRQAFPDDFGGLYSQEEINTIQEELPTDAIEVTVENSEKKEETKKRLPNGWAKMTREEQLLYNKENVTDFITKPEIIDVEKKDIVIEEKKESVLEVVETVKEISLATTAQKETLTKGLTPERAAKIWAIVENAWGITEREKLKEKFEVLTVEEFEFITKKLEE